MKKISKHYRILLILCLILTLCIPAPAMADTGNSNGEITILYTNDVHTYMNNEGEEAFNYAKLAALKKQYENALLIDAGDHIQGTAYGSMDKGETINKLMEAAGYDLATLGNHEFDYGMLRALDVAQNSAFDYVSCNFYSEKNGVRGDNVLDSYKIIEVNGRKVAIVGITTPETFTKSTPAYFQDEKGNYIYGISGGTDGKELYADVQAAIDAAEAEGADYIIALGHLGIGDVSHRWNSEDVIANTAGLDAFIDGHSHSVLPGKQVADREGKNVLLTQTGEYLGAVGKMTISADGTISAELISDASGIAEDKEVKKLQDEWVSTIDAQLNQVIGRADVVFDNYDAEGNRLVRSQETNTGDFAADALYYLFDSLDYDVDVAIMNGGGIRNKTVTGELTYNTCKAIHTFGNVACLQTVSGQQLLDALEWGARTVGISENGGLLHVSGLKYSVNTEIESTVQTDDKGVWNGGPTGEYRVYNVQILNNRTGEYEPLDTAAEYNLAGYNYTLRDLGDGFAMFDGAVNVIDYVMEDYMVLANYIESFKDGIIPADSEYSDVNGNGRISITAGYDAEYIRDITVSAKSQMTRLNGKKAVKVTWTNPEGIAFDGYEIYRSEKRYSGYGTEPYFTTENTWYYNTGELKTGTRYYYKVRGYKMVNGEKVYNETSLKAWRTVK